MPAKITTSRALTPVRWSRGESRIIYLAHDNHIEYDSIVAVGEVMFKRAFLGIIVLGTAGQIAWAAPTVLICNQTNMASYISVTSPMVIDLNETQGTVTVQFESIKTPDGVTQGGGSSGPLPAKFTPNTITFSYGSNPTVVFTINRTSGFATGRSFSGTSVLPGQSEFSCKLGTPQF